MMDTDNLKHINDTFGHDWGDKYIRRAGQCLAWNTPPGTLCARISGDEFNVLFYGYDSQEAIREEIRNLKTAVKETSLTLPSGRELHLSISGGIAWYPENSREFPIMKKYADFAMYQVKRTQKGELAEFDPEIYRKEAVATEKRQQFQKLIREELVRYYFQPIISGKTGETIAYEALMRVSLPMITNPGQVMELAREEGCLHEIERITMFKSAESYLFLEREGLISGKEKLFRQFCCKPAYDGGGERRVRAAFHFPPKQARCGDHRRRGHGQQCAGDQEKYTWFTGKFCTG